MGKKKETSTHAEYVEAEKRKHIALMKTAFLMQILALVFSITALIIRIVH